jgi:uncharacterized YccA/Bax inhibitor family protein
MSNPLLKDNIFKSTIYNNDIMTITGTINKSLILWSCLIIGAIYSWTHYYAVYHFLFPISILSLILSTVIIIKKNIASLLAPFYAFSEGILLGVISFYFNSSSCIVLNTILLTLCVLFCMLSCYKLGLLKTTPKFQKVMILATLAITLVYFIDFILNIFGFGNMLYIHSNSSLGIIINLIIVSIAAFNLIVDFDLIERGIANRAPKYMEWYSSFILMTTIIWLYLEVLKLLYKMSQIER